MDSSVSDVVRYPLSALRCCEMWTHRSLSLSLCLRLRCAPWLRPERHGKPRGSGQLLSAMATALQTSKCHTHACRAPGGGMLNSLGHRRSCVHGAHFPNVLVSRSGFVVFAFCFMGDSLGVSCHARLQFSSTLSCQHRLDHSAVCVASAEFWSEAASS